MVPRSMSSPAFLQPSFMSSAGKETNRGAEREFSFPSEGTPVSFGGNYSFLRGKLQFSSEEIFDVSSPAFLYALSRKGYESECKNISYISRSVFLSSR